MLLVVWAGNMHEVAQLHSDRSVQLLLGTLGGPRVWNPTTHRCSGRPRREEVTSREAVRWRSNAGDPGYTSH